MAFGLARPAAAQITVPIIRNLYAAGHALPDAPVGAGAEGVQTGG